MKKIKKIKKLLKILYLNLINIIEKNINNIKNGWLYALHINTKIIAIDSRFISERVNQLRNWNIEFFQVQILNKSSLITHLKDADIVHHLAGITDVAYVKKDSNKYCSFHNL